MLRLGYIEQVLDKISLGAIVDRRALANGFGEIE